MLPGLEMMACPEMAVSMDVMQHVINVSPRVILTQSA